MNAKVLLTALALGGAAVYAVRRFKARKSLSGNNNNKMQKTPAFSPTKTPTPPY